MHGRVVYLVHVVRVLLSDFVFVVIYEILNSIERRQIFYSMYLDGSLLYFEFSLTCMNAEASFYRANY